MPTPGEVQRDPTVFGVPLIQFFLGVLFFVSLLHGRHDLTILCVLVLGLVTLARLWSRLSLGAVHATSVLSRTRAFPGETLRLETSAANRRIFPVWLQVGWQLERPRGCLLPADGQVRHTSLVGFQEVRFRWDLAVPARGVYRVQHPTVSVADPLGFFPRGRGPAQAQEVLVYPRRIALRAPPIPHRELFGAPGTESPVQDPIYILGTRDYQHSQPARHIHWNASARHQRLQEKVFEPSQHRKVLLLVDVEPFTAAGAADAFERTLEVVGSLALHLDGAGCSVGLATNGRTAGNQPPVLPAARSPSQMQALLEVLARLEMEPAGDFSDLLRRGPIPPRSLSCVHFGLHRSPLPPGTRDLLFRRRILLVQVVAEDAPAELPPKPLFPGSIYRFSDLGAVESGGP